MSPSGVTATSTSGTPFKKIFIADLTGAPSGGFARKTELVDLMNISDPHDLNGDGATVFTFPYVTIESVLILRDVMHGLDARQVAEAQAYVAFHFYAMAVEATAPAATRTNSPT